MTWGKKKKKKENVFSPFAYVLQYFVYKLLQCFPEGSDENAKPVEANEALVRFAICLFVRYRKKVGVMFCFVFKFNIKYTNLVANPQNW